MKQKPGFLDTVKQFFKDAAEIAGNLRQKIFNSNATPALRKLSFALGQLFSIALKLALSLVVLLVCTLAVVTVYGTIYVSKNLDRGAPVSLADYDPKLTTKFFAQDPNGEEGEFILVETISGAENRIWAPYDMIPENLKNAVIAIEDKTFWEHKGVNWRRTVAAFGNMFLTMRSNFGGSTITQQLIKNTTGNDDVTVQRKFQEIFQAMEFEQTYSKEQILENYLNTIYLGENCYGVRTAAEEYFGKDLSELTLLESACLAGITNNPYMYNPYINPQNNRRRTDIILGQMYAQGLITEGEYTRAMSQQLVLARKTKVRETKVRSWYIEEVMRDLTEELMELNGWQKIPAQQYVFSAGLSVYILQDISIQEKLDSIWMNPAAWPATRDPELPQGTMLIMDHNDGAIVALTGSRTEKTANSLSNMSTMTKRPPGSSLKPLSVYSPAFEMGLITPYSSILDAPVSATNNRGYPRNSPQGYEGRISILTAVTKSKNTAAMRLVQGMTAEVSRDFVASRYHVTSLVHQVSDTGKIDGDASMAFGQLTDGISVKELTAAYCAFPNGGTYIEPRTYSLVLDKNEEILIDNAPKKSVAIKPLTSYYMTVSLKNAVASGTGARAKTNMGRMPVAGKTGTTDSDQDRWFAGYTPYYTAAAWFGYEWPRALKGYDGNPALIMWNKVMVEIHRDLDPSVDFEVPPGLTNAQYCVDSGLAPSAACSLDPRGNRVATGVYEQGQVPKTTCDMHQTVEVCTVSGHLARPDCPAETRKTVALLNDTAARAMPVAGIVLDDEQYTLRIYGVPAYAEAEGLFAPASNDTFYNSFCTMAHEAPPVEPDPDDPATEDPLDPLEPVDPQSPEEVPPTLPPVEDPMDPLTPLMPPQGALPPEKFDLDKAG